jgi:hypothetical protein
MESASRGPCLRRAGGTRLTPDHPKILPLFRPSCALEMRGCLSDWRSAASAEGAKRTEVLVASTAQVRQRPRRSVEGRLSGSRWRGALALVLRDHVGQRTETSILGMSCVPSGDCSQRVDCQHLRRGQFVRESGNDILNHRIGASVSSQREESLFDKSRRIRRAPLAARIDVEARSPVGCRDVMPAGRFARARAISLDRSDRLDRSTPAPLRKRAERDARRPSRRRDGACDGFALVRRGADASRGSQRASRSP